MKTHIIFQLFLLQINCNQHYIKLTYSVVLEKLNNLVENDVHNIFNLTFGEEEYNYLPDVHCKNDSGNEEKCKFPILRITNFNKEPNEVMSMPQVLLAAGIHGDEVVGTNVQIYQAEHIISFNNIGIKELLKISIF